MIYYDVVIGRVKFIQIVACHDGFPTPQLHLLGKFVSMFLRLFYEDHKFATIASKTPS